MAVVSASDFRRTLEFVHRPSPGTPADPIPTSTLCALVEVIPADLAEYFELRRADSGVVGHAASEVLPVANGTDEAVQTLGHQNPLGFRRWHPNDGPLRLSTVISRRELERREFYWAYYHANAIRDVLKVWLWSSPETAACVCLYRFDAEFSRRDVDLMGILQHHLIDMRWRAEADGVRRVDGHHLTPREAEILTWAARGHANEEVAAVLGISRATVRKHLEHTYEKLGVRSRGEALWRLTAGEPEQ